MVRILLSLAAAMLAATEPASAEVPGRNYGPLFESFWSTVRDRYYDPLFRGTDWNGVRERYRERAQIVRDDDGFAALARAMLAEIPSSHLAIVRPSGSIGAAGIGARTETFDGAEIVAEVVPLSDAWRQGLRPGDRLLTPEAVRGPLGSRATLAVEGCDGETRQLSIRREGAFWPPEHPGFRWRQIRIGPDTRIGYMRIDRFDDGAAELADRAMSELGNSRALIIDLRGNSGGNASALRLASYFGAGAEPSFALLARPYLESLGHAPTAADIAAAPRVDRAYTTAAIMAAVSTHNGGVVFWTETVEHPYRRPVFLLIGPETGSAAEGFAWHMRLRTPARLIGRTTAGALLSADTVEIGQGWSVTVPVHGSWGPDGQDFIDRPVPPHITVGWTRADLCAGRDPDFEQALRLAEAG